MRTEQALISGFTFPIVHNDIINVIFLKGRECLWGHGNRSKSKLLCQKLTYFVLSIHRSNVR